MKPDPLEVADGIEVQDACINFNRSFTMGVDRNVIVEELPTMESVYPVPAEETGDAWFTSNDHGLWWGFKDGSVDVPGVKKPVTNTFAIEHEESGVEQRVPYPPQIVQDRVNSDRENAVLVNFEASPSHTKPITTSLSTAKKILDRYVSGPLGSDLITLYESQRVRVDRTIDEEQLSEVKNTDEFVFTEGDHRDWVPEPADWQ